MIGGPQSRWRQVARPVADQIGRQCIQTLVPVPEQHEIQSLIGGGKRREWIFAMQRPGKARITRMQNDPRICKAGTGNDVVRWIGRGTPTGRRTARNTKAGKRRGVEISGDYYRQVRITWALDQLRRLCGLYCRMEPLEMSSNEAEVLAAKFSVDGNPAVRDSHWPKNWIGQHQIRKEVLRLNVRYLEFRNT